MKILGALALACTMAWVGVQEPSATSQEVQALRLKTLDTAWQRINDRFFDPKFNGVDWNAVHEKYLAKLADVKTDDEYYQLLNTMIGELKQSHFGVISPKAFKAEEEAARNGTEAEAGMTIQIVEGKPTVTRIEAKFPADVAGIRPGFVVTRIGKTKLALLWTQVQNRKEWFINKRFIYSRMVSRLAYGTPNQEIEVSCVNGANREKTYRLSLKKLKGQPLKFGELPTFTGFVESKRLAGKIGYVRLTVFMMPLLDKMKAVMASFRDEKAMIIDLRQNPGGFGGMAIPIAGLLVSNQMSLGSMKMRVGETRLIVYPQPNAFKGPVAILTDEGSASTSEILAGGLQEIGRVVVIGQTTTGAVLPSMIERLPDGSRLQYAIADYRTPKGVLLEGRGVTPDYPVQLTRAGLLKLSDPVMVKAQSVLKKMETLKGRRP